MRRKQREAKETRNEKRETRNEKREGLRSPLKQQRERSHAEQDESAEPKDEDQKRASKSQVECRQTMHGSGPRCRLAYEQLPAPEPELNPKLTPKALQNQSNES